jgi:hypothetical protein
MPECSRLSKFLVLTACFDCLYCGMDLSVNPFFGYESDNPKPLSFLVAYTRLVFRCLDVPLTTYNPAYPNRQHGRWHGDGCASYSNGDSYKGEYKLGRRHGRGVYKWHTGAYYHGMLSEGKVHGKVCSCHFFLFFRPSGKTYQEAREKDFCWGVTPCAF